MRKLFLSALVVLALWTAVGGGTIRVLFQRQNPLLKPYQGQAAINWAHPVAQGLVYCLLLNESGGANVYDLVNLGAGTYGSAVAIGYEWQKVRGPYYKQTGSSTTTVTGPNDYGINLIDPAEGNGVATPPFSLAWSASHSATNQYYIDKSDDNAVNVGFWIQDAAGSLTFKHERSTANFTTACTDGSINAWHSYAFWYDGNLTASSAHVQAYVDGAAQSMGGFVNGNGTHAASSGHAPILGANNSNTAGTLLNGGIGYLYAWNRILTQAEVQLLDANPYCFLATDRSVFTKAAAAVSNNMFSPAWPSLTGRLLRAAPR